MPPKKRLRPAPGSSPPGGPSGAPGSSIKVKKDEAEDMVTAKKRVKVKDDEDGVMVKSNSDKATPKKRVKVKDDEGVDGVDEDGVTIASDGCTLTEGDENYECAGCWRCSAVHFSYTVPQGQLEFQYATKAASFCRDCHTVWRLLYKARLTLLLLTRYLGDWERRVQFVKELVALLVLRHENCTRATASLISSKVDALNFIFELVNVPWPFFCVVEPMDVDVQKTVPASINFVQSNLKGSRGLLCLAPLPYLSSRASSSSSALKLPTEQQQRLQATVYTESDEDAQWWRENIDPEDALAKVKLDGDDLEGDCDDDRSKAETSEPGDADSVSGNRANQTMELTQISMTDFMNDKWSEGTGNFFKERFFGKQLTKALKLQHLIASGPEAANYLSIVNGCVEALASAKKLVPALVNYQRNFSSQKLAIVHSASVGLKQFFNTYDKKFGPKLQKIFWMAEFEDISDFKDTGKKLLNDASLLCDLHAGDTEKTMSFVLDCITNLVANKFLGSPAMKEKSNEAVRDEMENIVAGFLAVTSEMPGGKGSPLHEALGHAMTILEAAAPESKVAPAQLIAAKSKLEAGDACKKLWHLWFNSSAGTVLVADADMLLVASALDSECLNELLLCKKVLEEAGVPRRDSGNRLVGSSKLFTSGSLGNLFRDAARQLVLALKTWSPIGVDEHAEDIMTIIEHLTDLVYFTDTAASHFLHESIFEPLKGWSEHFATLSLTERLPFMSQEAVQEAKDLEVFDNEAEEGVLASAKGALEGIQRLRSIGGSMLQHIEKFEASVKQHEDNIAVKSFVSNEVADLILLLHMAYDSLPLAFADLVTEYQADAEESPISVLSSVTAISQRRLAHERAKPLTMQGTSIAMTRENGDTVAFDMLPLEEGFAFMVANKAASYFVDRFLISNVPVSLRECWACMDFLGKPVAVVAEASPEDADPLLLAVRSVMSADDEARLVAHMEDGTGSNFEALWKTTKVFINYELTCLFLRLCKKTEVEMPEMFHGTLEVSKVLDLLEVSHWFCSSWAAALWLRHRHLGTGDGAVSVYSVTEARGAQLATAAIDQGLKTTFTFLSDSTSSLEKNSLNNLAAIDLVPGACFNNTRFKACLSGLQDFLGEARLCTMRKIATAIEDLAAGCEAVCPRWAHIVSNDQYKPALAKRQILNAPGRQKLPDAANKLEGFMDKTSLQKWLGFSDSQREEIFGDATSMGEATLEMAMLTIAVAAAVNIVEDFGATPRGVAMAKEFVKTPRPKNFPKVLDTKVGELAKK